jgi:hypothetical protein
VNPALALLLAASFAAAREPAAAPSRAPEKGCAWRRVSDPELGLALRAQKCDLGFRRIYFDSSARKRAVYQVWRDAAAAESAEPVIWVYEKKADESIEAAIGRLFISKLNRKKRPHCSVKEKKFGFLGGGKRAYLIVPDEELAAESVREAQGDVPEPPYGERGESADGVAYFEFHPAENQHRFAFVNFGQEEHPLFDERSLVFLP